MTHTERRLSRLCECQSALEVLTIANLIERTIMQCRPAMTSFSQYLQVYRLMRPVIPEALRRPILNLLPSRRVKRFLNVIDTMHEYATKIYTEKKRVAYSMGAGEEADEKARDLITILRTCTQA